MRKTYIALCAAIALAACGQSAEAPAEAEAPAAPQSLMDQAQAQAPEMQPVFAYQQLVAYQQAHPEMTPPCTAPRATESRGIIPATVSADSIYAAHAGSLVFSVQCGELRSGTRFDPREHWLVVFAPGAMEPAVVNCADAQGIDLCPHTVPITVPTPTPAP
ncbi:MAG: hypothetical protein J0L81_00185 [Caulobacterales bacterium]|jgi:hypothetical protein|nr:hypothetical protein [Caulobacterales bacterium]